MDNIFKTTQVCAMCNCHISTAIKWAGLNHVQAVREEGINRMAYQWQQSDIEKFMARPKPGKRAKKKPTEAPETQGVNP